MAMNWRTFSVLVWSATLSAASDAREVEQITPPTQGNVSAIGGAAGGDVAPIGADDVATSAALAGDAIQAAMTNALIERLKAHTLTPEAAWKSGALDVEVLLDILGHRLGPWGGFYWERDDDLRRALVNLLIEHGGERLKDTDKLAPATRLWLADYYWSVKDARVVPLAESILSEIKTPVKGENALVFSAVERIAWYYRDIGEAEKSAQTWLRVKDYHADEGWWVPDAMIVAARIYNEAGQTQKAQNLYAGLLKGNNIRFAVLALRDQTEKFMLAGDEKALKAVLQPYLSGTSGELNFSAFFIMGYSRYLSGDYGEAQQFGRKALERFDPSWNLPDLDALASLTQNYVDLSENWQKEPLRCATQKVWLSGNDGDESATSRVLVYTPRNTPPFSFDRQCQHRSPGSRLHCTK